MCGNLQKASLRKPCLNGGLLDQCKEDLVGGGGFLSALQDGAVSALDAQTADLYERVRTRLEDNPDHADGHRHPLQDQPLIQLPVQRDPAGRILQRHQTVDAREAVRQLMRIELQPFHHCRGDAGLLRALKILPVCLEDLILMLLQRKRGKTQRLIAHSRIGRRHKGGDRFHIPDIF